MYTLIFITNLYKSNVKLVKFRDVNEGKTKEGRMCNECKTMDVKSGKTMDVQYRKVKNSIIYIFM